jgi:hypothetical protein
MTHRRVGVELVNLHDGPQAATQVRAERPVGKRWLAWATSILRPAASRLPRRDDLATRFDLPSVILVSILFAALLHDIWLTVSQET